MKKTQLVLGLCCALAMNSLHAQEGMPRYWQSLHDYEVDNLKNRNSKAVNKKVFQLDVNQLQNKLLTENAVVISLPLPNGQFSEFRLETSNVMAPELATEFPSIRTFSGYEISNPTHTGRFDITPQGFHGVFNYDGDKVFIDPVSRDNTELYQSYFKSAAEPISKKLQQLAPKLRQHQHKLRAKKQAAKLVNDNKITYRIAIATTGEYAQFHGGTKELTMAALVTMLNRVNEVYERDLAITMLLVGQNDNIIFTDPDTDPFENTDEDLDLVTNVINNAMNVNDYDIGHIVGTGGGGLAGFEVVCTEFKAEGVTGSDQPTSDAFYIDYVAHEIGHQFGADHTFNGAEGACDGNRENNSAYEPGSGNTIMSYAGICDSQNIQFNSDPYFHIRSIDQIRAFTQQGAGKTCGVHSSKSNQAPVVDAGQDRVIPARTPFTLAGSATDAENDTLSYSWQQFDLGGVSSTKQEDSTDDGSRPLFRTFDPVSVPSRTFPQMSDILSGQQTYGETLPTQNRDLNFRLVVRDNQGNLADDAVKLTVVENAQGFSVTAPSSGDVWQGDKQLVTWNTASTENAPVSCAEVDISLSTDSGSQFDTTLLSRADNTGSAEVDISGISTETARVKISCSDNVFFAINNANFTISGSDISLPKTLEFIEHKSLTVNEDSSLAIQLTDTTFNQAIDELILANGTNYQVNGLTVTPTENFNGELVIPATATAGALTSETFNIKVTVIATNDIPSVMDDVVTIDANANKTQIDVLANDDDIDGDTLTLSAITYTGTNTVVIEDNKLVYTPANGFSGTESLNYVVTDGKGGQNSALLTITVNAPDVTPQPEPEPEPDSDEGGSKLFGGSNSLYFSLMLSGLLMFRRLGGTNE